MNGVNKAFIHFHLQRGLWRDACIEHDRAERREPYSAKRCAVAIAEKNRALKLMNSALDALLSEVRKEKHEHQNH
jgi:hypothetical protein